MYILYNAFISFLISFYWKVRNSYYFKIYSLENLNVSAGQEWRHKGNKHTYVIKDVHNLKVFGIWVSENIITYADKKTGIVYSRLIFDFLDSFERI